MSTLVLLSRQRSSRCLKVIFLLFFLQVTAFSATAEELKELLASGGIPPTSFAPPELVAPVQGYAVEGDGRVVLAYRGLKGELLTGPTKLIRYDQSSGRVLRAELPLPEDDVCSGSVEEMKLVREFALLTVSISPSAACLIVVGDDLKLRKVLYGFNPIEVEPGRVVIIENMIHFAPVHPERLQLADLGSGKTWELYPPKDDLLRAELAAEHAKHMPSQEICTRMNDSCKPGEFDEDIRALGTDGKGRFAFLVPQSASHAVKEGEPPETVASQAVLYVYQRDGDGWLYCENKVDKSHIEGLSRLLRFNFDSVAKRCQPKLTVIPDTSTMSYNPTPPD